MQLSEYAVLSSTFLNVISMFEPTGKKYGTECTGSPYIGISLIRIVGSPVSSLPISSATLVLFVEGMFDRPSIYIPESPSLNII
jgi:hypothetical protein